MRWDLAEHKTSITPREYHRLVPFAPAAASYRFGWAGMEAASFRDVPDSELDMPPLTYHAIMLFDQPPGTMDLQCEEVNRHLPPPAGSVLIFPAGTSSRWRWRGTKSTLHVYLEPDFITRAAEHFGLDSTKCELPPLDSLELPHLRAALRALEAELTTGGVGGPLAAESWGNILAVYLIRHISAPARRIARNRDGTLPRARLRAVVEYIEEHLDVGLSLEEMAKVAHISPYHFARQFKTASGLPPHQYVITRRIERARQLLQSDTTLSLAEIAVFVGFSDQSHFAHHFKRLVGVTPRAFRMLRNNRVAEQYALQDSSSSNASPSTSSFT